VAWVIEYTEQFEVWWLGLTEAEWESIAAVVGALEAAGPALRRPYVGTIDGSRHPNMKELVVQHKGEPYRILFAFDPTRVAILLIGGNKTGDARWYERMVPVADDLYDEHLATLRKEGRING
jgi:hypothetical protein